MREFYVKVYNDLCSREGLSYVAVSHRGICLCNGLTDWSNTRRLCSLMRVKARVADENETGWAWIVEFINPLGRVAECAIPWSLARKGSRYVFERLAHHGFECSPLPEDADLILKLIRNWPEKPALTTLRRTGWTNDHDAFVLPSGEIITQPDLPEKYYFAGSGAGVMRGDLETWKTGVGALCRGNPNLIFGCSLAFSAPLLGFTQEVSGTIFNLFGPSSIGKTRVLRAALSVWPGEVGDPSWKSTSSGLEAALARRNHVLLGLDELPQDPHKEFGEDVYLAANGTGKARAQKDGTAVNRQIFQTMILSTGEKSIASVLEGLGKPAYGGQAVRAIDLAVEGRFGVIDELHGERDSAALISRLDRGIRSASGPAGVAFIRELMAQPGLRHKLGSVINRRAEYLAQTLGIDASLPGKSEVIRVLKTFGLVAFAGDLATNSGITGWNYGEATDAVAKIAQRWYAGRGGDVPKDQMVAITATRDFLARHQSSRLALLPKGGNTAGVVRDCAGYRDEQYFYVLDGAFREIHAGRDIKTVARHLEQAGYLVPGGEANSLQYRLPRIDGGRPRAYRIKREILGA